MEGGISDGGPSQTMPEVNTERTYAEILKFKEAKLAKDALAERRAARLTKVFLKEAEEFRKDKQRVSAEVSARHYQESIRRARQESDTRATLAEIAREQEEQMRQMIEDQEVEKREQDVRAGGDKSEREKWAHARQCYEQIQADNRLKKGEDATRQRVERMEAKRKVHEDAKKERDAEIKEKKKTASDQANTSFDKVKENIRKSRVASGKDRVKLDSDVRQKQEQAEKQREEAKQALFGRFKADKEKTEKLRLALGDQFAQAEEEKRRRVAEKLKRIEERRTEEEGYQRKVQEKLCQQLQQDLSQGDRTARSDSAAGVDPKAEDKGGKSQIERYMPPTFWSKDLVESNNKVKKEYLLKCHELKTAGENMILRKKYKELADGASKNDGEDDPQTRHLRATHNRYVSHRSRELQSTESAAKTDTASSPRKEQKCGLCSREFPCNSLVGGAMARIVEKARNKKEQRGMPLSARSAPPRGNTAVGEQPSGVSQTDKESSPQADGNEISGKAPPPLYDYRVPLCALCHQYVSIMH